MKSASKNKSNRKNYRITPEVSIVISVYDAEKRIEKVVDALLRQEFGSFEIVLVDDGSKDRSYDIMKRIASKDSRVRLFSQKNKGASAGRNLGISKAKGKYLVLTDDDVVLEKDWLKKTMPLLKENNVGFVASIIRNDMPHDLNNLERLLFDYAQASRSANIKNEGDMLMVNAISREAIRSAGLYDEIFRGSAASADMDLFNRIKRKGFDYRISKAKSTHLEEKNRFRLGFFIKKPYSWGKNLAMLYKKEGMKDFIKGDYRVLFLVFPFALTALIIAIILSFFSIYFLYLIPLTIIAYLFLRRDLLKRMISRKRNILEIIFIILLDILRIILYNIGSLSELLSFKRIKK